MQATGRVRFSFRFLFALYRDTDWNATRNFVLGKNGIIAACVGDDWIKIDRFKKKRNLNPHSTKLYLSKKRSKPIENHSSMCFSHVSRGFTRNMISRDAIRARKRRDRSQASFFCFSRMQSSSAFGGTFGFGHVLGQKKKRKKELTPLPPLSLTQKILSITNNNNRLSSEVTARSPRRN